MLPSAAHSSQVNRISLTVLTVSEMHAQTLAEWRVKLNELIARQRACPNRQRNASLRNQLSTAMHAAYEAIATACAEPKGEILAEAVAAVRRYFPKAGDARAVALGFPAVVDVHFFLMGPEPADSLAGLASQAEETVATIGKILDCGEVWNFTGGKA